MGRKPHGPEPIPSHPLRLPFDPQGSGSVLLGFFLFSTVSVLFQRCSPQGWFVCLPPTGGKLVFLAGQGHTRALRCLQHRHRRDDPSSIALLLLLKFPLRFQTTLRSSITAAVAPFQQFPPQHLRQGFTSGFERRFGARRSYGKGS